MTDPVDILKKAFLQVTQTSSAVQPWDEPLSRPGSIQGSHVLSSKAVPGTQGSWVSSGGYPYQASDATAGSIEFQYPQSGVVGPSREFIETNPGTPGYNDLNYVPYNWNTNRFGNKGGALLGHPISWEVVGPTLKSPYTHWQWTVAFNSAGVADTLTLVSGPLTSTYQSSGSLPTVAQAYGLSTSISDYDALGGLYLMVTLSGDGMAGAVRSPGVAITDAAGANGFSNPYELFRVAGYSGQVLSLKASKKLATYFATGGGTPTIRGVTLIRPKVTRLAGIPLSNGTNQTNQVFVFLPPEVSATSEYMPPNVGGTGATPNCPSWTDGSFSGNSSAGSAGDYGCASKLPVPVPVAFFVATLATSAPGVANRWVITATFAGTTVPVAGQVVKISTHQAKTADYPPGTLGWFEIASVSGTGPYTLTLKRVPEVNPTTGATYFGNGPVSSVTADALTGELYNNITSLFTGRYLDFSKIEATRLRDLIDPRESGPSNRGFYEFSNGDPTIAYKPDKAIFDTRATSTNPGNLMDLGFRIVLFPAKAITAGNIGPDFDNPIDTNNVVLDPTLTAQPQYLEIDYSAGVLYLSHPPRPGAGCTVAPNGIITDLTKNPRNEVVLYAACVPYSMEESQRGGGVRVLAQAPYTQGFGSNDLTDAYGTRVVLTPDIPAAPYRLNPGDDLTFSGSPIPANTIPSTGYFVLYEVDPSTGKFTSGSKSYYYQSYDPSGSGTLKKIAFAFGGPAYYTITANTRVVLLKGGPRVFNAKSFSDGARGAAKKLQTLQFKSCLFTYGSDGSVTLEPKSTFGLDDAYRKGSTTPGLGRTILVNGKAVELVPTTNTAGGDPLNASVRVNTTSASDGVSLVGFDFQGWRASSSDPWAGFLDRRPLIFTSGSTILPSSFTVTYSAGDRVTVSSPNKFWTGSPYNKTFLLFTRDLISITDDTTGATKVYVISDYGSTGVEVQVLNLDGTSPGFTTSQTGIATVYRTRLQTGYSHSSTRPVAGTWMCGQRNSPASLGDYGVLNLYAGSSSAFDVGDGGGGRVALAFWARYNISGADTGFAASVFDTMGRYTSTLNGTLMTGGSLPDYYYRGDYVSRAVKNLAGSASTSWAVGHVVEDTSYDLYRYDFLSLLPWSTSTYNATFLTTTPTQGVLEIDPVGPPSPPNVELLPYGSAVVEILTTSPSPTAGSGVLGLYLLVGYATGGGGRQLVLRTLSGGTPSNLPGSGTTGTIKIYLFASQGRRSAVPYYDLVNSASKTQTPSTTLGVGSELDSVGLYIAGPSRREAPGSGADRYAYRVTSAKGALAGATQPANNEVANLDLDGNHQALDFLYAGGSRITKKDLSLVLFNGVVGSSVGWYLVHGNPLAPGNLLWQNATGATAVALLVPIPLPSSSLRVNTSGAKTHPSVLTQIEITGNFYGTAGQEARVSLGRVTNNYATSTSVVQYQNLNGVTLVTLPITAGPQTTTTLTVTNTLGGDLTIDNQTQYLFLEITSNGDGGTSRDKVLGVRITWKDPGPRND